MADKRAFAVFDVGYLDNPKISDVFDASPIAVCMHFASVLYCAQHLTDGFIALRAMQRKAGGTNDDSQTLIDAGLWHEPGHGCEWCPEVPAGKLYVHDYTEHNRTSEGVKVRSSAARDNANARWEKARQAKQAGGADSNANRIANADDSQCLDRQKDRKSLTSEAGASDNDFEEAREDVLALCELLADQIEKNGSLRPAITKAWFDSARRMIDIDKRDPVRASNLIRWTQANSFWRKNVMSMVKFRKQYDQLRLAALEDYDKNGKGISADNEINVEAILGRDYWTVPEAPAHMDIAEGLAWKKAQRAAHDQEREQLARKKVESLAA